jgi:HlyD family secretion protein
VKWIKRLLVLLIVALVLTVALYYLLRPKPIAVSVKRVDRGTIESTVVNTRAGTVKACRGAQLSPAVGGQIAEWPVREGMMVKKGDLLLSLWNLDLKAQLALTKSEARAAKARAEAACLQADIAGRQAKRYLALQEIGATTEEKIDSLQTEKEVRDADCNAAKVSVVVSHDQVEVVRANLERTMLYAPFDGIIADLNGELGEFVTPSPLGVQTLPTVNLIDTSCFYVSAPIDEVDVSLIRVGMEARIILDAFRDRRFAGKVRRIADYVLDLEKQARTVEIEVAFTNPEDTENLLAGYSADAEVVIDVKENVLRVPTEAIMEKNRVYIFLEGEKKIAAREVTFGLQNWDYTEVISGLAEGDLVVVTIDRPGLEDGAPAEADEIDEQ